MIDLECQSASAAHWSRKQYESLFVTDSGRLRSVHFAWVAEEKEDRSGLSKVLAFLVARRIDAEWELENVVVAAAVRRQGVGESLLREFVTHARSGQSSRIFLEVRESNHGARALYRKVGFEETGVRKSYYSDPPEDAVLSRLTL